MKYFSQSVPSFYQFFYLPLVGIFTVYYFLYLPFPVMILSTSVCACTILSVYTKQIHFVWMSLLIILLTGRLGYDTYTQKQFAQTYNHKKIESTGVITDVRQNISESLVTFKTKTVQTLPANYTLLLHWPHYLTQPHDHDEITLRDVTVQCAQDSYQLYLYKESAHGTAHVTQKNIVTHTKAPTQTSLLHENKIADTLIQTIVLGIKINHPLYTHIKNTCNWWGIRHYLARSGLHFSIIFFFILYLLTFLPVPWYIKQSIISLLCITVYTCTWYSVSFLRSFLFYLLITACNIFHVRIVSIHLLNLTFCIVLLYNPYTLCFLDFQLTFAATYLLLWFNKIGLFTRYS